MTHSQAHVSAAQSIENLAYIEDTAASQNVSNLQQEMYVML